MGYAYHGTTARIIDGGKVYKEHEVDVLEVDPCARPSYRYTLKYKRPTARTPDEPTRYGWFEVTYAWWEIIEPWDNAHVRYVKWRHNKDICRQAEIVQREERKLRELTQ